MSFCRKKRPFSYRQAHKCKLRSGWDLHIKLTRVVNRVKGPNTLTWKDEAFSPFKIIGSCVFCFCFYLFRNVNFTKYLIRLNFETTNFYCGKLRSVCTVLNSAPWIKQGSHMLCKRAAPAEMLWISPSLSMWNPINVHSKCVTVV